MRWRHFYITRNLLTIRLGFVFLRKQTKISFWVNSLTF